jgi:hypothetical protein
MGLLLSAQRLVWVVVWETLFEDGCGAFGSRTPAKDDLHVAEDST